MPQGPWQLVALRGEGRHRDFLGRVSWWGNATPALFRPAPLLWVLDEDLLPLGSQEGLAPVKQLLKHQIPAKIHPAAASHSQDLGLEKPG